MIAAHVTDIFALAVTPYQVISASGSSALTVYSTIDPNFLLEQTLEEAHPLGCHHLVTSRNGSNLASAGFDGEVKIWTVKDGQWTEEGKIVGASSIEMSSCPYRSLCSANRHDLQMATRQVKSGR